jgi:hypothetical protein
MALAFKRAVADAEKAVESANKSIQEWYKPPTNPALSFDYEGIKAIEGVSKQNPNSVEGPKNITLVNWVRDNASRFHSVWGDVQYKDKKYALDVLNKHLDKVIVHVDDKGVAGKYNSYNIEFKGKDLHIYVHIDFTNYPQQLNLADEKGGHVDYMIWDHLDQVGNITYEIRKANLINYESSPLNTYRKYLKEKVKKEIPIEINWDSLFALEGKSCEYSNKPDVPNRARAVNFLGDDGKAIYNVYYSIETLVKDQMGMEAFLETFDKVHIGILPGGMLAAFTTDPPKITKDGKTLKFEFQIAASNFQNARNDYSKMAKQIEALL